MSLAVPPNNLEQLISWIRTNLSEQLSSDTIDLSQIKKDISNLKTKTTDLQDADIQINNRLTSLGTDVSDIKTRLTNAESNITNLQTRMTAAESTITNIQTTVTNMQAKITSIENFKNAWFTKNQAVVNNEVEIAWNSNI